MVFSEDMTVMQVRPNYSIVYQFRPTLRLEKRHAKTRKDFVTHLKDLTSTWKEGDYFLRCSQGTFCYLTLNGRSVSLQKKSKVTGKEYLCWQYFSDTKKNGCVKK